jgi:hypothetical protein
MADLPPTVDFRTNIPQEIQFPWGDFKEGQGQHGPWYKYNVNVGTTRQTLFATEHLHTKLQEIGNLKGRTLTITKVEREGNKKDWEVTIPGQLKPESAPEAPSEPSPQPKKECESTKQWEPEIFEAAKRAFRWSLECHRQAGFEVDMASATWAESVRAWAASILIASLDPRAVVRPYYEGDDPDPNTPMSADGLPFDPA